MKERVMWSVEGNINDKWNRMVTCVKNTVKIVGERKSSMPENKKNMVMG